MKTSRKIFDNVTSRALGARLRELRGDRTLAEFSELVGVGRTVWSNYEAGRRLPSHETLAKVAALAGIQDDAIAYLAGLKRVTAPMDAGANEPAYGTVLWLYDRLAGVPPASDRFLYWAARWDSLVAELSMRIHDEAVARDLTLTEAARAVREQLQARSLDELAAFVDQAISTPR